MKGVEYSLSPENKAIRGAEKQSTGIGGGKVERIKTESEPSCQSRE
jgi:hypothetical protein